MDKGKLYIIRNWIILLFVLGIIIFLIIYGIPFIMKKSFEQKISYMGYINKGYSLYESSLAGLNKDEYNNSNRKVKESETYTLDLTENTLNYSNMFFRGDKETVIDVLYDASNNIVSSNYQYIQDEEFYLITAQYYPDTDYFECKTVLGPEKKEICSDLEEYSTRTNYEYEYIMQGYKKLLFLLK